MAAWCSTRALHAVLVQRRSRRGATRHGSLRRTPLMAIGQPSHDCRRVGAAGQPAGGSTSRSPSAAIRVAHRRAPDFGRGVAGDLTGATYPLGAFVHRRDVIELAAWPLSGRTPAAAATPTRTRRGPVAPLPELGHDARVFVFDRLRRVADRSRATDSLLYRQALYRLSYDRRDDAAEWMLDQYRCVPRPRGRRFRRDC